MNYTVTHDWLIYQLIHLRNQVAGSRNKPDITQTRTHY